MSIHLFCFSGVIVVHMKLYTICSSPLRRCGVCLTSVAAHARCSAWQTPLCCLFCTHKCRLNGSHLFRNILLGGNAGRSVWVRGTYERRMGTAADHEYSLREKTSALQHYYSFLAQRLQVAALVPLRQHGLRKVHSSKALLDSRSK